jgi:hypothetical protein
MNLCYECHDVVQLFLSIFVRTCDMNLVMDSLKLYFLYDMMHYFSICVLYVYCLFWRFLVSPGVHEALWVLH